MLRDSLYLRDQSDPLFMSQRYVRTCSSYHDYEESYKRRKNRRRIIKGFRVNGEGLILEEKTVIPLLSSSRMY